MEDIPKDIEKYLVKDEIVEKRFDLKGCIVCASNKRLFIKKGNTVRDLDYSHISSIEFKRKRSWGPVVGGFFLFVLGLISLQFLAALGWILLLFGVILVIAGLVPSEEVEMAVVGLSMPVKLSGERTKLDSLFKLIREKRV